MTKDEIRDVRIFLDITSVVYYVAAIERYSGIQRELLPENRTVTEAMI